MNRTLIFTTNITNNDRGESLLSFLNRRFPYHSDAAWRRQISAGRVFLNEKIASADQEISPGDNISYHPEKIEEPKVSTDIELLDSTGEFLITGKPAGTPVNRTGLIISNTYINILRRKFDNPDIHLMHRLDRETSGILLCALSKEVCRKHQQDFSRIMNGKYYLAIVRGKLDVKTMTIDLPIGADDKSGIRSKMTVSSTGKPCRSLIHTIAASNEISLVLVRLFTGRKHQIRCHLAHLGHPVIGDKIYDHNGRYYLKRLNTELQAEDFEKLGAANHTLHAWAADITLPGQDQKRYFAHCFSADFIRYAENFAAWRDRARQGLLKLGAQPMPRE